MGSPILTFGFETRRDVFARFVLRGAPQVVRTDGQPVHLAPLSERILVTLALLPDGQWWDLDEFANTIAVRAPRPALSRLGHEVGCQVHRSLEGRRKRVSLDRLQIDSDIDRYRAAMRAAKDLPGHERLECLLHADRAWPSVDFRHWWANPPPRIASLLGEFRASRVSQCLETARLVRLQGTMDLEMDLETFRGWVATQPDLEECQLTWVWAATASLGRTAAMEALAAWQARGITRPARIAWASRLIEHPVTSRVNRRSSKSPPASAIVPEGQLRDPSVGALADQQAPSAGPPANGDRVTSDMHRVLDWLHCLRTERIEPLVVVGAPGGARMVFDDSCVALATQSGAHVVRFDAHAATSAVDCLVGLIQPLWFERRLALEPPGRELLLLADFLDQACGFGMVFDRLEIETTAIGSSFDRFGYALERLVFGYLAVDASEPVVLMIANADSVVGLHDLVAALTDALAPHGVGLSISTVDRSVAAGMRWRVELPEEVGLHERPTLGDASPFLTVVDSETRRAVEVAAVTSIELAVDVDLALRLLGAGTRGLLEALPVRTDGQLVADARLRFVRPEVRMAYYDAIEPERRRILHAEAFAELKVRFRAKSLSADDARAFLTHAVGSRAHANITEAVAVLRAVAEQEINRFHDDEALSLLEDAVHVADIAVQYPLFLLIGDLLRASGRWDEARSSYISAARAAHATHEPHAEVAATIRLAHVTWDPECSVDLEHRLLELNARLEPDQTLLHLKVGTCLAGGLYQDGASGHSAQSAAIALDAIAATRGLPDGPDAADLLMWARKARIDIDTPRRSLAIARLMSERCGQSSYHQFNALLAVIVDEIRVGLLPQAREHSQRYIELTEATPAALFSTIAQTIATMWKLRMGMFQMDSEKEATRPSTFGGSTVRQIHRGQELWAAHELGLYDAAILRELAPSFPPDGRIPLWATSLAWLHAEHGDARVAWSQLRKIVGRGERLSTMARGPHRLPVLALVAESLSWLAVRRKRTVDTKLLARRIGEQLDVQRAVYVLIGWPTVICGSVSRFRGLAAFAEGRLDAALPLFLDALDADADSPPTQARIWLDLARTYEALDDVAASQSAARNATQLARQLNMKHIEATAQRMLVGPVA